MIKCREDSRLGRLVKSPECYTSTSKHRACIEFEFENGERRGFHVSQLIEYNFKEDPDSGDDKNAPMQTLTLAFSTADVAISGWRLSKLVDLIRHNELDTIQELPKRYAEMDLYKEKPFVASIKITPIEKK